MYPSAAIYALLSVVYSQLVVFIPLSVSFAVLLMFIVPLKYSPLYVPLCMFVVPMFGLV